MKPINKNSFILSFLTFLITSFAFAEGTPTLSPNAANITAVLSAPDLQSGSYYNCGEDNRIYFNIGNTSTERLYFGFDWRGYSIGIPGRITNLYYRIRRPDGSVAVTAKWDQTLGSIGSIDTHAKALIGPHIGGTGTGGYEPLIFNPTVTGEHWIEFYRSNDAGVTPDNTFATGRAVGALFDLTVATSAGVKRNGRVHSDKWGFVAVDSNYGNFITANSEPNFYVYTTDQVVLFIDFRPGFQPIAYNLAVNSYGVNPVGAFNITRRSINTLLAPPLLNGYKVFLNNPDSVLYPVGAVPSPPTFLTPAITGCTGAYTVRYNTTENGDIRLLFDLNGTPGYQAFTSDRLIDIFGVTAGNNTIAWDGLDGLGAVVPDGAQMTLTLFFLKGRFNLPLHDAELNKNGFNVQSIAPVAIPNSQMYWDDTQLGNVGTSCATDGSTQENNQTGLGLDNTINGTPSPARAWSGDGNLLQTIPAPAVGTNETDGITCNDFGNVRLINTYGWGLINQSASTTVFKGCSDLRVLKFVNIPSPNVGSNVTFTIQATNLGISNDTNVVVNDILPSGYTYVSSSTATGSYNNLTGVWTIGNFANGANATLTIVATVRSTGNYLNTAVISGTNNDPNLANNTSSVPTTPNAVADLAVLKVASTLSPIKGTNITFTITATNNGPSPAIGVNVSDIIPSGYTLVSAIPAIGTWTAPNWSIGNLAVGASTTIIVTATVRNTGVYTNTAIISGTLTDLVPGNNTSSVTPIPVNAVIDARDDVGNSVNGSTGGPSFANVLINDTVNGNQATLSNVILTQVSTSNPGITLNTATGQVNVAPGTPAGNYTLVYQICEIVNPTNCDTATVFVPVTAAPIVAQDDTMPSTIGLVGNPTLGNVLPNNGNGPDTLNGTPLANLALINMTVVTPATPIGGAPVPTLNTTTGVVSVPVGTPAGTYTIVYQICEKLNTANCDTATVTIPVTAAIIDAVNDTMPSSNGATGNTNAGNVLSNNTNGPDTLNGTPVTIAQVNLTVTSPATPLTPGAPVPSVDPATGVVSIPPGTPAGTYTITYQICEKLNPTNCDTAIVTVPVGAAAIIAQDDTMPSTNGLVGNPTLGNVLPNNGNGPDTLNGTPLANLALINMTVVTPATPIGGAPVPTLNTITGVVSVPVGTPADTYTIVYQICEKLNTANCDNATVTIPVTAAIIDAVNDTMPSSNGATGNTNAGNVLSNNTNGPDTLNGTPVTIAQVNLTVTSPATPLTPGAPVPSVDPATGVVSIPPGTPAGTYTITYQICEKLNPTNCDTAIVTVPVGAAAIIAQDDTMPSTIGLVGNPTLGNVLPNNGNGPDTLNGTPLANLALINMTVVTPATPIGGAPVPTLNTITGVVSVPVGTPAGTYTIVYQICEKLNTANCDNATVTIPVTAAIIDAVNDTMPSSNGATGNTNAGNVLSNNTNGPDTLNGTPVTIAQVNLTVTSPATPLTPGAPVPSVDPATGVVSIPPGTPAGTYTITYQICEKLNPTNCDTAIVTVPVGAAAIIAQDDTMPSTIGLVGNPTLGNVLPNNGNGPDTLNGTPLANLALINMTVVTPATPIGGAPVPTLNTITGVVSVPVGTPAGTYTIVYQICEKLNTANCDNATVTIPVTAAIIDAVNDTMPSSNGATGNTNAGNVLSNNTNGPDTLNGTPVTIAQVNLTVTSPATPLTPGAPVPSVDPATGVVSIPPGTPAGTYTITYQICEKLNPTNCDTAIVTVPVGAAAIIAQDDTMPSTIGLVGNPTLGNVLPNNGNGPDTLNGTPLANLALINMTVVTPATPIGGAPVPTLNTITGVVSVPVGTPAGTYTIVYQICEKLNTANCDNATVTIPVTAAIIDAVNDTMPSSNGATGNTNAGNVLSNNTNGPDTLNGTPVTIAQVNLTVTSPATPLTPGAPVPSVDPATGVVSIPPGTPAGTYTITYQICEKLNPTNCDTAIVTVPVGAAAIIAQDDTMPSTNGLVGNPTLGNVLPNNGNGPDTLNGTPLANLALINMTVVTPATPIGGAPVPTLNTTTGVVSVPVGTPAGTYTIVYQICEKLNTANCDNATVTIPVTAAIIDAVNDTMPSSNGATGNTNAGNVLSNNTNGPDTLNGTPVTIAQVNLTVTSPATPLTPGAPVPSVDPATGVVSIPPGTPAGTYTITYQICEKLNPTNCDTAIVTVPVGAAAIIAQDDTMPSTIGLVGNPTLGNVLPNNGNGPDTLNGTPLANLALINMTVVTPATPIGGAPVPTLNTITGVVSVPVGTPAGTYTIVYQICEKLNTANCDNATVTIPVTAAIIDAVNDTMPSSNGATGNTNAGNVLSNNTNGPDTLNGTPVTIAQVNLTVTSPATPLTPGAPVPSVDPATGVVSIPPGTPAGTYTITYQICEKLNPTNCDTAIVTVPVGAAAIIAQDDTMPSTIGLVGNPTLGNVLPNNGNGPDTLNGTPLANLALINMTVVTPATPIGGAPVPTLNTITGVVSVPVGTPAGTYTIVYQICEKLNTANCDNATVTIPVTAAIIDAVNDTMPSSNGATGNTNAGNVLSNNTNGPDTLNGTPVTIAQVNLTVTSPATPLTPGAPVPSVDPATGVVSIPPGTPAGTYTITYQICEKLNPTNCDTAIVTVPVGAAAIIAQDDTMPSTNGLVGNPTLGNVLPNNGNGPDTLNGTPLANLALINMTVVTPATPIGGAPVPTLNTTTGVVSVPVGTPAGTYTIVYQICENLNTANCDNATVTIPVTAAIIDAVNDTMPSSNGATGNTNAGNVLSNNTNGPDTLNGTPVTIAQVNLTVTSPATPLTPGAPVPSVDPATGVVSIPPGTPAGTYTITYQICEKLNPTNCDTAIVTVPVGAAAIIAQDDTMPSTIGLVGNPTLGNVLPNNGNGPDTLNGTPLANLALINMTVVTPATPIGGAPVPTLNTITGVVSVPVGTPAGTYTIVYQICEKLNTANCDNATVTIPVTAAIIDAVNDTMPSSNGATGNTNAGNVLSNNTNGPDTLNGTPVTIAQVNLTVTSPATPLTPGAPVPSVDPATGVVSIPPGTPAGTYTITYQICEKLNPTNCDTAIVTVPVGAAAIIAQDDTMPSTNGLVGNPTLGNVLPNNGNGPDTLNGTPLANLALINMTVVTPATPIGGAPVPTLNTTTGVVSVPVGTPAGTYTIVYQICENLNTANCDNATVTIPVTAAIIDAVNDTMPSSNGATGNTNAGNVLSNNTNGPDTLNGTPVTIAQVNLTVTSPATPLTPGAPVPSVDPATGVVSIPPGTPAGTYTITYQICEKLNPTNCDTAIVTVPVGAAAINAQDDTMPSTIGLVGNPTLGNVLPNNGNGPDTLNGTPLANLALINMTVVTPATPIGGAPVPTLNTTTGVVSVPVGTPAGTYTIVYQICENLNTANCDNATVTIPVTAAIIDAVNDTMPSSNGATGNTNAGNVLSNNTNGPDTLNGTPVTIAQVNLTVTSPATPLTPGAPVPSVDPATGVVSIPPGTPAGTYTITYQICEKLNPTNCDTAIVTVPVGAAAIIAQDDTMPSTIGLVGNPTLGNVLPNNGNGPDTLNGTPLANLALINMTVVTPATPIGGAPVPTLNTITGVVSVPVGTPAGTYTIVYQICEKLNTANCDNATVTIPVTAAIIDAVNDTMPSSNGATGNTNAGNVLSNNTNGPDTLNGTPVTIAQVNLTVTSPATPLTPGAPVPSVDPATGVVSIPPGTPAGTYTITYQICEKLNPTNCDTAIVTVPVGAAAIIAQDDTMPSTIGLVGNPTLGNVLPNNGNGPDTLNGTPLANLALINMTVVTPATPIGGAPVPTLNTTTGVVSVPVGTPAGTYTIVYQICEKLNTANCDTATVTIPVTAAIIDAVNDTMPSSNGATGNTNAGNVLSNNTNGPDTLNGTPVTIAQVNLTVTSPATPLTPGAPVPSVDPATGVVSIPPGTPAGTYTITYQICEKLNPTNCDTAIVTVPVGAAAIIAQDDTMPSTNGLVGNPTLGNVLPNNGNGPDTLNGTPLANLALINMTVVTPATPIGGAPVPTLNTTTGVVSVPVGTPAGTYTIVYQICENLNTANCDNATVTIPVYTPSIDILKNGTYIDSLLPAGVSVGDTILYNFTVTNTGSSELTNITVTDPLVTIVGGPITLAVGQVDTTTFTATYVITQADIDAGQVNNLATATGTPPSGPPVTDISSDPTPCTTCVPVVNCPTCTLTPLPANPSINLLKNGTYVDSLLPAGVSVGDTILYNFTVTNTGNVTLTNVTVTDPLVTIVGGPITLAVGQVDTTTFTATYVITQADIDAGQVNNLATATGTPPSGPPVTDISSDPTPCTTCVPVVNCPTCTLTPLPANPSINLLKNGTYVDSLLPAGVSVGDTILYNFTVTNTGNVTLTNVIVTDPLVTIVGGPITLAVGQVDTTTFTATYVITQADIDAGQVNNLATATGTPPSGPPVTDISSDPTPCTTCVPVVNCPTCTLTPLPANPSINLLKNGTYVDSLLPAGVSVGDTILYNFTVTNTGNVTLTNVIVTDPLVTIVGGPITLAVGQVDTTTFTATYVITQADIDAGQVNNLATATGTPPSGPPVTDISSDPTPCTTCVPVVNCPTCTLTPLPANPSINLLKNGTYVDSLLPAGVSVGDTILYNFTVTNTGNVTLTNVTVTDPLVTIVGGPITLAVGQVDTTTFTATYVITQADIDAGQVNNLATATGTPPSGPPVTDISSDPTPCTTCVPVVNCPTCTLTPLPANPSINLLKNGTYVDSLLPAGVSVGDTILYNFTVTNTGNVTLTNVTVTDPLVTIVGGPITLAVGQVDTTTFTATYVITQADIDAGQVNNLATATGTPPSGPPVTDISSDPTPCTTCVPVVNCPTCTLTPLPANPSINLLKNGTYVDSLLPAGVSVGDTILYNFTVTNTGNVTLTNVTVTDPLVTIVGGPITLAVGQVDTTTFTATYVITQADIDAGQVNNLATATGTPPSGPPVTDISSDPTPCTTCVPVVNCPTCTLTPLPANPSINLLKNGTYVDSDSNNITNVGDTIIYNFTVTNTGNVTLTNVTITDPLVTVIGGPITLLVGQSNSTTFTATYTLTQADITAGQVNNLATATGNPPLGPPVSDTSSDPIPCETCTPVPNCPTCTSTPIINAINDTYINIACDVNGIAGNILSNDTYGTTLVNTNLASQVNLTILTGSNPNISISNTGVVTILSGIAIGSYTYTYQICSASTPNTCDQATVIINIVDTTPPVWVSTLPPNVIVSCDAIPVAPILIATDTCSTPIVAFTEEINPGNCPNNYTIIRTWTATDAAGNVITYSQTITVQDITNPVFVGTLPLDATVQCSLVPQPVTLTATDNCGTAIVTFLEVNTPGICAGSYTLTRTWTATDLCNNITTHVQVLTVIDTTAPTFVETLPTNLTVQCTDVPTAVILTAIDNCGLANVNFFETSVPGSCAGAFTITRTWIAIDSCGNTNIHIQTITVQDTIPPVFNGNLPSNIIVECSTVPAPALLTATDNCGTANVTFVETTTPGSCAGAYTITRTWTATDLCNNTTTHVQTITVQDTTAPTFAGTLPNNITVECSTVPAPAVLTASDNCGTANVTLVETTTPGSCAGAYTITRTWTATDLCNNTTTHVQTITVQDTTAPTFAGTLPNNITVECSTVPAPAVLTATDNCGTANVTLVETTTPGSCAGAYTITRTWTAIDLCSNTTTHVQTITVQDTTAPTFVGNLPNNITVECSTVPLADVLSATDNCGTANVTFVETTTPGSCAGAYTITRTWTATDLCNNTVTHVQTITVQDVTPPTFVGNLPNNVTVECSAIPTAVILTATDNCATPNVTYNEVTTPGSCSGSYTLTRTWTATDLCNNVTTHTQIITVQDTTAPVLITPIVDAIVSCNAIPALPNVQFTDNCTSTANIVVVATSVTSSVSSSGDYTIIRTWTVNDACNNQAIFTQTISVNIPNYLQVSEIEPICSNDSDLVVDVASIINSLFPNVISTNGTWTDVNNSGALNLTTGEFTPYNLADGDYIIQYNNNDVNCPRIVQITIPVDEDVCFPLPCTTLLVHNAFTPNGDGTNEFFIIDNITDDCYKDNTLEIYNRWGVLVYDAVNYDNETRVFSGISEGRSTVKQSAELPTGTYFYILKYKDTEGNYETQNGYLYLSR